MARKESNTVEETLMPDLTEAQIKWYNSDGSPITEAEWSSGILPAGKYRVIDGRLYRILPGSPPSDSEGD